MRNSKSIGRFILKGILLILPLLIILGIFFLADPMKCFRNYSSPLEKGVTINDRIFQSRWLKLHPYKYNAFIFGSSRGKSFHTSHWQQHLDSACPFNMCVNDESIYGIARKMEFLNKEVYPIHNALIILDERILSRPNNPDPHLFREYPDVSGETYPAFYQKFLLAFLKPAFLKAWLTDKWVGKSNDSYFFVVDFRYHPRSGDHFYYEYEKELAQDEERFYQKHASVFYQRSADIIESPPVIGQASKKELVCIKEILTKNNTSYRIIISPNYDQKPISPTDLATLKEIFGDSLIFDFSGKNWFTEDIHHYYEERHFRPFIADSLMKLVYPAN